MLWVFFYYYFWFIYYYYYFIAISLLLLLLLLHFPSSYVCVFLHLMPSFTFTLCLHLRRAFTLTLWLHFSSPYACIFLHLVPAFSFTVCLHFPLLNFCSWFLRWRRMRNCKHLPWDFFLLYTLELLIELFIVFDSSQE